MSSILVYVKKYGTKTFLEKDFNEIDNLILSSLSYVSFKGIINTGEKITLGEAGRMFFDKYSLKQINNNVFSIKTAIKLLKEVYKTPRFKNIKIYHYVYKSNENKQFSAMFMDLTKKLSFISFEGTDDLISGWKEDFELSYKFPTESQKEAIAYINKNISPFSLRNYIVGGHSKGGNLALIAAMHANHLIANKIIKIYSNDGPGVINKLMQSKRYEKIKNKYSLIIPNYSVVGLLLRHPENYKVVLSNKKGFHAHNFLTWQVIEDEFVEAKLSSFSKRVDKTITNWLDTYDYKKREQFVIDLFDVLKRAEITSLLDIKDSSIISIIKILKESKKMDKANKDMILDLIRFIFLYIKEDAANFLKRN